MREFSRHLHGLTARQEGRRWPLQQLDKGNWQIECVPSSPLILSYEVYAFDNSVRTAWLDTQRGFFNGTSLCLRVHGQENSVHSLELRPARARATWEVATAWCRTSRRTRLRHLWRRDYDELVDCPVEMGAFWSGEFKAGGVPHRLVVAGASESFDHARLLADVQKICEAEIRFWHGRRTPAVQELPLHAQRGGRRLRRAGASQLHRADRLAARPAARWARPA